MSKKKKTAQKKQQGSKNPKQVFKISQALQQAQQYQKVGEWQQAEALYYQILQKHPHHNKALDFYKGLGSALNSRGRLAEAITYLQRALSLNPNHAEMQNDLGIALGQQGKFKEAKECFQTAIALKKNFAQAYYNVGIILNGEKQFAEAITCYKKALSINPNHADAYNNWGNALSAQNEFSEAVVCYEKAIALNPNYVQAHNGLGVALKMLGKMTEAIAGFQQAVALKPDYIDAHNNLGVIFTEQNEFEKAEACFQTVLTFKPNDVTAHSSIGDLFKSKGMIDEGITHYKRALEIEPTNWKVHDTFLFTINYSPNYDQAAIFSEHQRFNEQHALPLAASISPHLNDRKPQRRLKIGYVSADFRQHSVAFFIREILAHHNHEQFEIVCYYNNSHFDKMTRQLQEYADDWVDCVKLSDDKLADKIRADQIDILVDLAGHTSGNRLLVFAMKPAPVQVSYLGYPNTTGLTAIDYRITDAYRDPQETSESFSSESLIRIPGYYCYRPIDDTPPVSELPCLEQDTITFSSFNHAPKMNHNILALWAEVLNTVSGSKLLLKTKALSDEPTREALKKQFAQWGIAPDRLFFEMFEPAPAYLKSYWKVDIGLDTYPYNGSTTTYEALWMGIPVVTLAGDTEASWAGLSTLSTLGLTELIAYTPEQYVDICVKLASDTDYLQQLRASMRERMLASPLMDYVNFTACLEAEYRKMWETWCRGELVCSPCVK